jgi:hypothetical protein
LPSSKKTTGLPMKHPASNGTMFPCKAGAVTWLI